MSGSPTAVSPVLDATPAATKLAAPKPPSIETAPPTDGKAQAETSPASSTTSVTPPGAKNADGAMESRARRMSRRAGNLIRQGSRSSREAFAKGLHIQRAVNDIDKTSTSLDEMKNKNQVSWLSATLVVEHDSALVAFVEHFMVFTTLYTMMSTSIHLGFKVRGSRSWEAIDMVAEVLFMLRIPLGFCTAINREDKISRFGGAGDEREVQHLHMIALHYIKGLLIVDVMNAIPLYMILSIHWPARFDRETADSFMPIGLQVLLFVRMMVFNTMRLHYGKIFIRNHQTRSTLGNPKLQRMVELSVIFFFLAHYVACTFFRIALEEGLDSNDWTQPLQKGWDDDMGMADDITTEDAEDPSYQLTLKYWVAMSAALTSMSGNAVVAPKTVPGALFQSCIIIVYFVLSASLIATFTALISEMDSTETAKKRQIDGVQDYLRSRQAPSSITKKILAYYEYLWKTGQSGYNTTLLSDLPQKLRLELDLMLKRGLLENVPLFKLVSPAGLVALVQCLSTCIVLPDELVISQGDSADCMFFLVHGSVQVEVAGSSEDEVLVVQSLSPGAYFGELALLDIKYTPDGEMITGKRTSSVRALVLSELQVLSVTHFLEISEDFPDLRKALEYVAKKRQAFNKDAQAPGSKIRRLSSMKDWEKGKRKHSPTLRATSEDSPNGEAKEGNGKTRSPTESRRRLSASKLKSKFQSVGATVMKVKEVERRMQDKTNGDEDDFIMSHEKAIRVVQAQSVRIDDGLKTISSHRNSDEVAGQRGSNSFRNSMGGKRMSAKTQNPNINLESTSTMPTAARAPESETPASASPAAERPGPRAVANEKGEGGPTGGSS